MLMKSNSPCSEARHDLQHITKQVLQEMFPEVPSDRSQDIFQDILSSLDSIERRILTRETLILMLGESPDCVLALQWQSREEGTNAWAALAREQEVHRSTITRGWLPKAIKLFVQTFLKVLQKYLYQNGREEEWHEFWRHFV